MLRKDFPAVEASCESYARMTGHIEFSLTGVTAFSTSLASEFQVLTISEEEDESAISYYKIL